MQSTSVSTRTPTDGWLTFLTRKSQIPRGYRSIVNFKDAHSAIDIEAFSDASSSVGLGFLINGAWISVDEGFILAVNIGMCRRFGRRGDASYDDF